MVAQPRPGRRDGAAFGEGMPVDHVDRLQLALAHADEVANFVVRDLDRALAFYRDTLGLEVEHMHESPPDSYSYPVFEIDRSAKLRFALLTAPGQPRVDGSTALWMRFSGQVPGFWTCRRTGWKRRQHRSAAGSSRTARSVCRCDTCHG